MPQNFFRGVGRNGGAGRGGRGSGSRGSSRGGRGRGGGAPSASGGAFTPRSEVYAPAKPPKEDRECRGAGEAIGEEQL